MRKALKFYMILMCAAALLGGCTEAEEVMGQGDLQIETPTPEATQVPEEEKAEQKREIHPITAEGIDYLRIDGIELEPGLEIAMVATDSENSFYEKVKKGAAQAVSDLNKKLGYTGKKKLKLSFASPKTENSIDQINIIDQFLDKAPDALCIAFSDAAACKTQMEMAKNNGIKLIAFDTSDEDHMTESLIATDNTAAAEVVASKLFEAMNYEGKIAVIVHNSTKQTGQERYRAITNKHLQEDTGNHLRFVDVVYVAQDDRTGKEIFDELLEKHPDLGGVICTDVVTTEMAIDYAGGLEEKTFKIAGVDMSEKIRTAIEDGTVLGTVAQDPYGMGYATVVAAARSIAGMDNAQNVYSDHLWIDSSNLESDEAQSLINNYF